MLNFLYFNTTIDTKTHINYTIVYNTEHMDNNKILLKMVMFVLRIFILIENIFHYNY